MSSTKLLEESFVCIFKSKLSTNIIITKKLCQHRDCLHVFNCVACFDGLNSEELPKRYACVTVNVISV